MDWLRGIAAAFAFASIISCHSDGVTAPPPNVVVTVTPALSAAFAGQVVSTHAFAAATADTLGNPLALAVSWTTVPSSALVTVSTDGIVSVAPTAPVGDYVIHATAAGVTGRATVRVLPRPPGKLVFVSTVAGNAQVFVKDFSNDGAPGGRYQWL